jgi:hypothetical protein
MPRDPKTYEDDDGRVICNMDVAGMPWHDRRARRERKAARSAVIAAQAPSLPASQGDPMTRSEMRRYVWNSVLAGLLIVAVFSATWVLFILFCTKVWFR